MNHALAENQEAMQKRLLEAQKESDKVKEQLKVEKFNFSKEMEKAKVELDNTRKELKGYQDMIYSMEKAGLLDTRSPYSIEFKNDELFINGRPKTTRRYHQPVQTLFQEG
jgi:hypothetical protein